MNVIKGLENFPVFPQKTAVALGNFDGVHLGHQKILETLVREAKQNNLISIVLTFSPHPKKIVGKEPIAMIQSLEQRMNTISQFQVHSTLILSFTWELSEYSGEDFIQRLVLIPLKAEEVIVGDNFCFGKNRTGCSETLRSLGQKHNFRVLTIPPVTINSMTVSSSLIRRLLHEGDVAKANLLLGRPYEIEGSVIRGKNRGRNLGFPTANIRTENEIVPRGVFLSRTLVEGKDFPSLTNAGECPTFDQNTTQVETYLLNFDADIYGQKIQVRFLKKIREERRFSSPEELTLQIKSDLRMANAFFKVP